MGNGVTIGDIRAKHGSPPKRDDLLIVAAEPDGEKRVFAMTIAELRDMLKDKG